MYIHTQMYAQIVYWDKDEEVSQEVSHLCLTDLREGPVRSSSIHDHCHPKALADDIHALHLRPQCVNSCIHNIHPTRLAVRCRLHTRAPLHDLENSHAKTTTFLAQSPSTFNISHTHTRTAVSINANQTLQVSFSRLSRVHHHHHLDNTTKRVRA